MKQKDILYDMGTGLSTQCIRQHLGLPTFTKARYLMLMANEKAGYLRISFAICRTYTRICHPCTGFASDQAAIYPEGDATHDSPATPPAKDQFPEYRHLF